jgi:PHS family inorganic phosphate transporter-like MFS transporter
VQAILPFMKFRGVKASNPNSDGLGWIFIIFGFVMGIGAIFAWTWIPNLQNIRDEDGGLILPTKTLEELGEGLVKARQENQVIGMRSTFIEAIKPLKDWWTSRRTSEGGENET